jgi:hypothetical protein
MKTTVTRLTFVCVSLIALCLITGISYAEIDPESIAGMWLFDEGSGNVAEDSSGKGNNGTIHGGAEWVSGKFGKALSLDGSDDYVEIAHDDSLMVGKHTITIWFKLDEVPTEGMAVVTKDDWAPGFWLDGSIIRHHTQDPPTEMHYIDGNWTPDTNWRSFAVTWDGEKFEMYLDGDRIDLGAIADTGRNPLTEKPLCIGIYLATGQHDQWGEFFHGIIDEVAVFNEALSEDHIKSIMDLGLSVVTTSVSPSGKIATAWASIKVQY